MLCTFNHQSMNVLLVNIDSIKIPNLALAKIEMYHNLKGDKVYHRNGDFKPDLFTPFEKVYVSVVFKENIQKALFWKNYNAVIGGSGFDVSSKLPAEIDCLTPKINIGFSTRGCNNLCSFCIVHKKEGKIEPVADLYDIWDGKTKEVTFLDNNILQLPEHFKLISNQAQKENLRIDFNQGLDIRLITDEIAFLLSKMKMKRIRFALDHNSLIPLVTEKLKILKKYMPKFEFSFYVLVGYDTNWLQDMERLNFLKENKCVPYLMRYETIKKDKNYILLARWVNQVHLFKNYTFNEFIEYNNRYR